MRAVRVVDLKYWVVLFYGSALAVLVLATMPAQQAGLLSTGWDKGNHITAFLVLGLLGLRAHPSAQMRCLLGLLGFGIAIELVQACLPDRQSEWKDVVADGVGLGLALTSAILVEVRSQS